MTYGLLMTAQLLDTDGSTVVSGTPLANAFDLEFMDELSGPGTGSCSISLSEAGAAEMTPGRFVQILVGGTARFTFIIEGDPEYLIVGEGEEAEAVLRASGRGWAAVFDRAIVEPEVDLSLKLDSSWRVFSFASPSFPNAGAWAAPTELYEYLDGVSYGYRYQMATDGNLYPSPISFPVPTSPVINDSTWTAGDPFPSVPGADYEDVFWIWPSGQETTIGYAFFRRTLTISADGLYTFAITADNFFTLFLEGVPILGEQSDHLIWQGWKEVPVPLTTGTYTVAVVVENVDINVTPNPAGLIMTVHTLDSNQFPNDIQLVTDDAWVCDFSATVWPGWTPGQIIATLITEATSRGALSAYASSTFAATTDTASNAWSDVQDGSAYIPAFAVDVGATIMAALGKMRDEGHIEWHVQPDAIDLDVWAPDSLGGSSGVSLEAGVNLLSLVRGATDVYANALLVQWERGYVWVTDSAEITAYGDQIEDVFASEASTEDEAERQGEVELLERIASGWPAVVVEVEPTSAADAPYEAFTLGETVEVPAVGGGTENLQVLSIGATQDANGYVRWRCELNRRWRSTIRSNYELLREIGGRSGYNTGTAR